MITCITPTRDRSHIFPEIITCINNQTVKPDKWIIVDDGVIPLDKDTLVLSTVSIDYVRMPVPYPGVKTHTINARAGLHRVSEGSVFIIDDDDYYAPTYIEKMCNYLKVYDIVGTCKEIEYSLRSGGGYQEIYRSRFTTNHHTCFNTSILDHIHKVIDYDNDPRMDLHVWDHIKTKTSVRWCMPVFNPYICVSFKQWPDVYNGYCRNHRKSFLGSSDPHLISLKNLLGEDFERYSKYIH